MRIAIIGDPGRRTRDDPLIAEAKARFGDGNAIYAPINQVRFDIGRLPAKDGMALGFGGMDITKFSAAVFVPTSAYAELFYTALYMLDGSECVKPFNSDRYLTFMHGELLRNHLKANGVAVRDFMTIASNAPLDMVGEVIKYPVIMRPQNKKVFVNNEQTLKDIVALYRRGTPIMVEKPIKSEDNIRVFVLGDEVIAAYREVDKRPQPASPDRDVIRASVKIRRVVGSSYCAIRFLRKNGAWIVDTVSLSPDFAEFQSVTGVNVASHVVFNMQECVERGRSSWYRRLGIFLRPPSRG